MEAQHWKQPLKTTTEKEIHKNSFRNSSSFLFLPEPFPASLFPQNSPSVKVFPGCPHHIELSPDDGPFPQRGGDLLDQGQLVGDHGLMLAEREELKRLNEATASVRIKNHRIVKVWNELQDHWVPPAPPWSPLRHGPKCHIHTTPEQFQEWWHHHWTEMGIFMLISNLNHLT